MRSTSSTRRRRRRDCRRSRLTSCTPGARSRRTRSRSSRSDCARRAGSRGALPELLAATERCAIAGDAFVHLDTRSDNICFVDGRAILVDWNWASVGRPLVDAAFWMPSLFAEGGPAPTEALADAGELTAVVSGFFAPLAWLPPPAGAPTARPIQLTQLKVALPWAVAVLGLPPLDR